MSKRLIYISVLAASAGLALHQAGLAQDSKLSAQDRSFMMEAAKGGMMEVQMGHLGHERASSPAVKELAQRLTADHTMASQELMALAKQKGVTLPPDKKSPMPAGLSSRTGADFDREFTRMAVTDHEKDIATFEKEASSGSDQDVKAWASKTLPTLHAHLDAAKAIPAK
jgi:putative membrane protein